MLRITMNKSASGAKKYYSESYYKEGKDSTLNYYSEKDQSIGQWHGKAAERLGLTGDIDKNDFAKLCDNINPETGKTLTGRKDKDRTVGYDLTFNASKSVTLAYAFGNAEEKKEILTAFRDSVNDTMKQVETGMQTRVRSKGKNENRDTGNIAYGEFIHFTTRPVDGMPDPHLHAHCFVFNATYDEKEEKFKAGQFRQINQDAPYYEACFHSNLAAKLEKLGYGIEKTKNGFEIAGIDKETVDKFSRRTKEIEEHAKENNITDDKLKSKIGARTREAKRSDSDAAKEQEEWKARLTEKEIKQLASLKKKHSEPADNGDTDKIAKDAINYSLQHHLERKSVASDKEILATAIKEASGKALPQDVEKAFARNDNILSVKENGRTFITTKDALAEEKILIANVNSSRGKFSPINENYEYRDDQLNEQQKKAVYHALNSTDGVILINGKAGTGKTTLMRQVKNGLAQSGKTIYPFAPSAEASKVVQRKEGFENADTLASMLQSSNHDRFRNQVIWIDEAGLVSNKDMNKAFEIAKEQNARIILSGDTRQHNSVERGDALRVIEKYSGITSVTIDKVQRQKKEQYKQAVELLSDAKTEKGFRKLESIGAIKEISDHNKRVKAVAEDYYKSSYRGSSQQNVLVIAPTHAEGEAVTSEIRNKLKEKNKVANDNCSFSILKNLQYTLAEKQKAESYQPGNILAFHQNIKGIKAGSRLQVTGNSKDGIIAKDCNNREHTVALSKAKNFNVFETKNIDVSTGDRIRITGNGKATDGTHLFNGITYDITGFTKQGEIKLSNGSVLPKNYGHWNYGYVSTSHSSQGKTTDKVIISQSSMAGKASSLEQFYVSVSRGRQAVSIYTDDKAGLLEAVSDSSQRLSATELIKKQAIEHGRTKMFEKMKEMAKEAYEKLKPSNTKNHELPGKDR